jgi:hypothetical protein
MPDTMIERVARALYERDNPYETSWKWDDPGLDAEHPGARERYLRYARAAIRALTEPTDGMVRAGVDYRLRTSLHGDNDWPTDTCRLLGAMLTAALEETPDAEE